jgi:hypothetical protein
MVKKIGFVLGLALIASVPLISSASTKVVIPKATCSITTSPSGKVAIGTPVTVTWKTTNATEVLLAGEDVPFNGSKVVIADKETHNFLLSVIGIQGGTACFTQIKR